MKPFPVQYKLDRTVCPVCGKAFHNVKDTKGDPEKAARAMLPHLLDTHPGDEACKKAKRQGADVLLRSSNKRHPRRSTPYVLTHLLGPRVVEDENGVEKTVGSQKLVQQFRMLFGKFHSCRGLYRRTGPMCRHEVCKMVARATSMGNCVPVTFRDMTITPKFMQLVIEFPRRARKFRCIGDTTEQVIENMHATGMCPAL